MMQKLSIDTLPIYASVCRFFVIVCPVTTHCDSNQPVGPATYARRGWSTPPPA